MRKSDIFNLLDAIYDVVAIININTCELDVNAKKFRDLFHTAPRADFMESHRVVPDNCVEFSDLAYVQRAFNKAYVERKSVNMMYRLVDNDSVMRDKWAMVAAFYLKTEEGEFWMLCFHDISRLSGTNGGVSFLPSFDPMTGVLNKTMGEHRLQKILNAHITGMLVICDIDNFKRVNDTLGHLLGDTVITIVAETLRDAIESDPGSIICRIGGDEFMFYLPGDYETCNRRVTQIRKLTSELKHEALDGTKVTLSFGVCYNNGSLDADELQSNADLALHYAKNKGKNTAVFYTPEMSWTQVRHTLPTENRAAAEAFAAGFMDYIFNLLFKNDDTLKGINGALAITAMKFNMNRAFLHFFGESGYEYAWVSATCYEFGDAELKALYAPEYGKFFDADGVYFRLDISSDTEFSGKEVLDAKGITSLVHVAIFEEHKDKPIGVVGFEGSGLAESEEAVLSFTAKLIALAVANMRKSPGR